MRKRLRLLYSTTILFLSSCTTIATHFPGVYAIDVEQGNIIDQEMINQLRPNMNKRQVLYIMGSPMLTDAVHPERWDYIYSQQPGGEERVQKRISLYFKKDRLVAVKGDFRPSSIPAMRASNEEIVEVPRRVLEKTLFEKIAALFVSDDTAVPANKTRIPENIDKPEKTQ